MFSDYLGAPYLDESSDSRNFNVSENSPPPFPDENLSNRHFVAPVYRRRHVVMSDKVSAQCWLGENGLSKSKAKKLLAAALRNQGSSYT